MTDSRNILVVDDDQMCRMAVADILKDYNYQVTTTRNGQEALASLKKKRYRLLITDLQMPGMTGVELLKKVKTLSPKTWVIVMTGNGEMDFHSKSINLETCQYLNKPVSIDKLMRTVTKVFPNNEKTTN